MDDHSVRVLTNDDDVKLAHYFADDALVLIEPGRWAYPVWMEGRRLPDTPAGDGGPFVPPVTAISTDLCRTGREGATYGARPSTTERADRAGQSPDSRWAARRR